MKKISLSLCWLLLLQWPLRSQNLLTTSQSLFTGLNAYSQHHPDAFSFSRNVAALSRFGGWYAGIRSERRFMLAETTVSELAAGAPLGNGVVGMRMQYAGFSAYREYAFTGAYAMALSRKMSLGVHMQYHDTGIPDQAHTVRSTAGLGVLFKPNAELTLGLRAEQISFQSVKKSGNNFARLFLGWGLGYDLSEQVHMMTEICYEPDFPVMATVGLQYDMLDRFHMQIGIRPDNYSGYLSAGFLVGEFRICVSGSYLPALGFSPGVTLLFDRQKPTV